MTRVTRVMRVTRVTRVRRAMRVTRAMRAMRVTGGDEPFDQIYEGCIATTPPRYIPHIDMQLHTHPYDDEYKHRHIAMIYTYNQTVTLCVLYN